MTAIVACSISVLALIGQALERQRTEVQVDALGVQAMAGALDEENALRFEAGWGETIQAAIETALSHAD